MREWIEGIGKRERWDAENDNGEGLLYQGDLAAVRRDIRRTAPMVTVHRITRRT
ncbi:hypothetical protein PIB30_094910, partial [Stylosanthes scabra]|nr:hypothetical protein [Stylosanthes scabra]